MREHVLQVSDPGGGVTCRRIMNCIILRNRCLIWCKTYRFFFVYKTTRFLCHSLIIGILSLIRPWTRTIIFLTMMYGNQLVTVFLLRFMFISKYFNMKPNSPTMKMYKLCNLRHGCAFSLSAF